MSPFQSPGFKARVLNKSPQKDDGNSLEDFLWQVHEYTNEYIRFADTKAAFIVVGASTLIGTLIGSSLLDSIFRKSVCSWYWSQCFGFTGLLLLSLSTFFSLRAIWPRLWNKTPIGFIFWESIAGHGPAAAFSAAVHKTTPRERTAAIAEHLTALARVSIAKYRHVKYSLWAGVPGGVFAAIALLLQHAATTGK